MSKQLLKSLTEILVKGASVKVADSDLVPEGVRGVVTTIRSKGLVPCNGKGQCRPGAHCIKHAVFVVNPAVEPEDGAGWRHGAAKVCLTQLINPETGEFYVPAADGAAPEVRETTPEVRQLETDDETVSWESLARAFKDGSLERLARQARSLKCENDLLVRRLAEVQEQLIAAQRKLLGEEPAGEPVAEEPAIEQVTEQEVPQESLEQESLEPQVTEQETPEEQPAPEAPTDEPALIA